MKNNFDIKPTNWPLIARLLFDARKGTAVPEENETKGWSQNDKDEWRQSLSLVKKIDLYHALKKHPISDGWQQVQQKIETRKNKKIPLQMFWKVAAVFILVLLTGAVAYQYFYNDAAHARHQLVAFDQPRTSLELPDGTEVFLNSGSKLYFPKKFHGKTREVTLEGEAFFNVEPNPTKPFIINAGKAQVKVLGTSFNVNAYPGTDKVEVIVESGKVSVARKTTDALATDELILAPGDKGILLYPNDALLKSKNNDNNFLAWKTYRLIFRETSLDDVVTTLEKVYNTDIDIVGENTGKLLLTGQYQDYSLDFVLEVIASALQLEIKKEDQKILLYKKS